MAGCNPVALSETPVLVLPPRGGSAAGFNGCFLKQFQYAALMRGFNKSIRISLPASGSTRRSGKYNPCLSKAGDTRGRY
jgi:hypothetical protein